MKKVIALLCTLILASCASINGKDNYEQHVSALAWTQNAAEFDALYFQAYNLATFRLKNDLKWSTSKRPRAVVLDVDETVLDNSPYQAKNVIDKETYNSVNWKKWVDRASAKALPGVKEFLEYAQDSGVEIFYISNRSTSSIDATYKNLLAKKLPVKRENMLFRTNTSSKNKRREKVFRKYRVVLYIGDQLTDFIGDFEHKNNEQRRFLVQSIKERIGKRFIIVPNLMYGDWENALFNYDRSTDLKTQNKLRRQHLYPY